jgi:hypothetical protein
MPVENNLLTITFKCNVQNMILGEFSPDLLVLLDSEEGPLLHFVV